MSTVINESIIRQVRCLTNEHTLDKSQSANESTDYETKVVAGRTVLYSNRPKLRSGRQ